MDSTRKQSYRHVDIHVAITCAGLTEPLFPTLSFADGARVAQKAKLGEIVRTCNVAARPPTEPVMGLIVSGSPNPRLVNGMQNNSLAMGASSP